MKPGTHDRAICIFVQSNSDKQLQHGLLFLMYKTKSTIKIKTSKGPHSQGLTKSQGRFQVSLRATELATKPTVLTFSSQTAI